MNDVITNDEQADLVESLGCIIENYMQLYLALLPKYNFDEQLYNYLYVTFF